MGKLSELGIPTRLMKRLERWLYRNAARIIVLLPRAKDYIVPLGIPENKIVYIPNGVEVNGIPKSANASNTFTLMYFGAHGQANGLQNVLQALQYLNLHNDKGLTIRLRLIGDGPAKPRLMKISEELKLTNVSFEPPVSKNVISELASSADAFIFNLIDADVFKYGISSNKLFDYLASARPIIFCCNAGNNPVAESDSGITVAPNNPEELADAIATLASLSIAERTRMGVAGFEFVKANHSLALLAKRLAVVLYDLSPVIK
jgi:glycosyltransferase involved in cell wall biosynthesis